MKNAIFVTLILIVLCGCEKTLLENPKSIAAETFYTSKDEVESAVNASYFGLQSSSFNSYNTILMSLSDVVYGRGSLAAMEEYNGFSSANITNMQGVWSQLYICIRNANLVIKNAKVSDKLSEKELATAISEVKFLRGLSYFMLVRLWGGVPLRTEENMEIIDIPRSSVAEVYKQILSDLNDAERNLPDKPRLLGTASKWSAKAVLSDVYLTLKQYKEAMDKSKEIIDSKEFELVQISAPDDYENIFGADLLTSTEEIFYFKYNDQYGWSLMNFFHHSASGYKPYGANYFSFFLSKTDRFYEEWDDRDLRKQHNFYSWDIGIGPNTLLFKKFIDKNGTVNPSNDFPLYRYPEILMIFAESSNQLNNGPTDESLEAFNKLKRRSYGYPSNLPSIVDVDLSGLTKDRFFDLILQERSYETILECKRWFDLLRTGLASEYVKIHTGKTLKESMLLWPIPEEELSYNKAIDRVKDQNPGY